MIDVWYGDHQRFGHLGRPQRWVNVLGRVRNCDRVQRFTCSLNDGVDWPLMLGPDGHRLANPGDFNAEIGWDDLRVGENALRLKVWYDDGRSRERGVVLSVDRQCVCSLPHRVSWADAGHIQDVAQVTDGLWRLTEAGVRVVEPYYDRVIALGDLAWTDYEVRTTVTFHGIREPDRQAGDGGAGVIHAAIAVRWPGHDDDGQQPRVKWYPLGATAEFRVNPSWEGCSWRILGGGDVVVNSDRQRGILRETPYRMKHRVCTASDGGAVYRVRLWQADEPESAEWDLELRKPPGGAQSGGALLIAHYTEVTFGDVEIVPV
jgi:hypothetical protein